MTALQNDVICALATPTGIGAIGVIRISGKDCLQLISPIFSKNLADKQSHSLHFGTISTKNSEIIDEVLISVFKDGKSFTGEESAEIACHGSNYILQRVLGLL